MIGDPARGEAAHHAEAEHQRQHLRAARDAVAEIAAIGDDMDLRHRHGGAAGEAGEDQQRQQDFRRDRRRARRNRRRLLRGGVVRHRRLAAQRQAERQHRRGAEDADPDIRLAPADCVDEMLQDGRPDRAGEVVAAGADPHRDAAIAREPMRDVGDQRPERSGAAEHADQQSLHGGELPEAGDVGAGDIAEAQHERPDENRNDDAAAVGEAAHEDAAEGETQHRRGIGQRGLAAIDAELELHRGQHHDGRP